MTDSTLTAVRIEDIAQMRQREGIDDDDLRADIRRLAVGGLVRLTLRAAGQSAGETVTVRITSVNGPTFQGTLADVPTSKGLSDLPIGWPLTFTVSHIHSIPKGVRP